MKPRALPRVRTRATLGIAMAILAVALGAAPAWALAADAYEPDDSPAAASAFAVGGLSQARTLLSTSGPTVADYDWVTFEATAGVTYDIRTAVGGTVNPDTVLSLYDSDASTLLAFNDDFFGPFSRIEWTCGATRTVFLQVTDADTHFGSPVPQTGEYTLSVAPGAPSITGTVVDDETLAPIGAIKVTAFAEDAVGDWYVMAWTQTFPDGKYALFGLFDGEYVIGFEDVTAFDASYETEYYDDRLDIDSADLVTTVDGETATGIDAALSQVYSITGRVTAAAGGSPLADVAVTAWEWSGGAGAWTLAASTMTGTDGSFALGGLGTGTYRVRFVDSSRHTYRTRFFGDGADIEEAADVSTVSGATVADVDASMVPTMERIAGRDRYTTAVAIARAAFPDWDAVTDVVVASGEDRAAADPLAAAGLCWAYDAPLVLVSAARTPPEVAALVKEIADESGAVRLHVVGGPVSVPAARIAEIEAYVGGGRATSERVLAVGGRYDLAAAIARRMAQVRPAEVADAALIANGADAATFFDALALSALSRAQGMPILLVRKDQVPPSTSAALTSLGLSRRIIGGGPNTVSDGVKVALAAERWWGRTRYDTAAAIAEHALDEDLLAADTVAIVSKVPDGLAGGVFVGEASGPLLVTAPSGAGGDAVPLSAVVYAFLHSNRVDNVACYVLGGRNSVSSQAIEDASLALE